MEPLGFTVVVVRFVVRAIGTTERPGPGSDRRFSPNARLELRHRDTGVRRQTLTNEEGFYSFLSLKAGTYQATLQVQSFRTVTRESIMLEVGDRASLDFNLQLARTEEQVTVTSDHAIVNPLDPAVSTVVDQEIVQNMPLNGRSFQSLIALTPGVVFTAD